MTMTATDRWMRSNCRRGETSGCGADICFSCDVNEQTSGEAGQKARKREFASGQVKDLFIRLIRRVGGIAAF